MTGHEENEYILRRAAKILSDVSERILVDFYTALEDEHVKRAGELLGYYSQLGGAVQTILMAEATSDLPGTMEQAISMKDPRYLSTE